MTTIDFQLYLKKKPESVEIGGKIVDDLKDLLGEPQEGCGKGFVYSWKPDLSQPDTVFVMGGGPSDWNGGYFLESGQLPEEKARNLPKRFKKFLIRNEGIIRPNKNFYDILRKNPLIKETLAFCEPVIGITEFTKGNQTYLFDFKLDPASSLYTIESAVRLMDHFVKKYNGIVWDEGEEKFGMPDPKSIFNSVDCSDHNLPPETEEFTKGYTVDEVVAALFSKDISKKDKKKK